MLRRLFPNVYEGWIVVGASAVVVLLIAASFFYGFGTIFNDRLDAYLADLIPVGSKVDSSALRSSPEALRALPGAIRVEVIDAFARALHVAFLWGIPLAAIGFVAVLFLRELPLRESAHVGLEAVGEDLAVAFEPLLDPETVPDLVDPPPAPGPSAAT